VLVCPHEPETNPSQEITIASRNLIIKTTQNKESHSHINQILAMQISIIF